MSRVGKHYLKLYRALIRLYPAGFRREYGDLLVAHVSSELVDARNNKQRLRIFTYEVVDLIRGCCVEQGRNIRTKSSSIRVFCPTGIAALAAVSVPVLFNQFVGSMLYTSASWTILAGSHVTLYQVLSWFSVITAVLLFGGALLQHYRPLFAYGMGVVTVGAAMLWGYELAAWYQNAFTWLAQSWPAYIDHFEVISLALFLAAAISGFATIALAVLFIVRCLLALPKADTYKNKERIMV